VSGWGLTIARGRGRWLLTAAAKEAAGTDIFKKTSSIYIIIPMHDDERT
jgi:hypothetical protein